MSSLDVTPCKKAGALDCTPKRGRRKPRSETPTRPGRKVATKLAPIFKKILQDSADSDLEIILTEEEKERQRIRQEFLRSGVPDEVRKQQQVLAAVQLSEYPPVPRVSHVQQIEQGNSVWTNECFLKLTLKNEEVCSSPVHASCGEFGLIDKTKSSIDVSTLTKFSSHPGIDSEVIKTLVAEINTSNTLYPAKRTYRQLVTRKTAAEKGATETVNKSEEGSLVAEKQNPDLALNKKKRKLSLDPQESVPPRRKRKRRQESTDSVSVVEEDKGDEGDDEGVVEEEGTKRRLSLRRRSTRKSKVEEQIVQEIIEAKEETEPKEETEAKEQTQPKDAQDKCSDNQGLLFYANIGDHKHKLLWTDKYAPSSSKEIVGNSRNVEKLRVWLQDWKKMTDLEMKRMAKEMEKQAKRKKQQLPQQEKKAAKEWSDESDFEQDSDSGSDYMPESDWEIGLCNTMLITGPHGIGKTATVNALAEELGYKVFEVNASGKRAGKQVLTQLQEATQSHQVSKKNLEDVFTTILSGSTAGAENKPKDKPLPRKTEKNDLPTAFTNLFNKKKSSDVQKSGKLAVVSAEKVASPRKGKGKKTSEGSPKKKPGRRKRGASTDDVIFVKEKKTPVKKTQSLLTGKGKTKASEACVGKATVSRQDSESAKRGLDLSSCSLILFEEVDLVFEEDKGFWAAIQTFMNTTKRPIIMTTSDSLFAHKFDPKGELKMELLHLRRPNLPNTATYLQLVALAENVRTRFSDVLALVESYRGDIRQCLLMLQYWIQSGGSVCPLQQDVHYQKSLLNKKAGVNAEEPKEGGTSATVLQSNSATEILNIDETANLPKGSIDTDDEFQLSKPMQRRNRKAFVIEDDSSMDSFLGSPVKLLQRMTGNLENILEEEDSQPSQTASLDAVGLLPSLQEQTAAEDMCCCEWTSQYPYVHTGCNESCLCLYSSETPSPTDTVALLKQISHGYSVTTTEMVKSLLDADLDIIYLNLIHLLPLPKTVKPLFSYTKFQTERYTVKHRLSRIKNRDDLFDSEMDSDSETEKGGKRNNSQSSEKVQGQDEKQQTQGALAGESCKHRKLSEGVKIVMSAMDSLSDLYESFSLADSHLTFCKDKHEWLSPNLNNVSLLPGQSDCRNVCDIEGKNVWKHNYGKEMLAHVQLGNYGKTCGRLTQVMNKVSCLPSEERTDTEKQLSLPVDTARVRLLSSELTTVQSRLRDAYKSAIKNVYQEVNPKSKRDGRSEFTGTSFNVSQNAIAMEYMAVLRTICKAEKFKEESKTKRRFLHYLESQRFTLKRSTTETLCTSFT